MATPGPNLFHRLHKWAHRQDENFLTEAVAVVLEQLLALAPAVGTRLIAKLTGGFIDVPPEAASTIELHTQVEAVAGRPDLEIRIPHKLAWVEVKAESELRTGQLEGYRVLLKKAGGAETKLMLLTRYPQVFGPDDECSDLQLRWFEVADWFGDELAAADEAAPVADFLVRQFLGFLESRNMTIAQVGKYLSEGLRAFSNLMNMLREAANLCKVTTKPRVTWDFFGIYLTDRKHWVGVVFADPGTLCFSTGGWIDATAAAELGVGEVFREDWAPEQDIWGIDVELDSEEVHFFSRSKVSQMQWLEEFLRDCLEKARSIEAPDQPEEES